jgi:subtilisin family serine protease
VEYKTRVQGAKLGAVQKKNKQQMQSFMKKMKEAEAQKATALTSSSTNNTTSGLSLPAFDVTSWMELVVAYARVKKRAVTKLVGGLGMILAKTTNSGKELIVDSHLLPTTKVGEIIANKIQEYVKLSQYPTTTILLCGPIIGTSPAAPKAVAFSSRRPNYLIPEILKPNVIALDVYFVAGWTGFVGPPDLEIDPRRVEFNIISGTSMSCPHVSGIIALL